ncbi:MAG: valine--tRNA ligase [Rickettsiales bacterium]|jgi:valyl-tRNA synthetase|nr:valine--tRNA ligase [Rickettsiales bacterium]
MLDQKYDHKAIEDRGMQLWETCGVYKFDASRVRDEIFAIDTPPPTVSGSLHIGHIFGYTQADIMARFHRMCGKNLFFPIGWDDNGLPTERRVQNYFNIKCDPALSYDPNFRAEHKDKFDAPQVPVSRKNFIEHCRRLIDQDEAIFEGIFRRTGMSYDWSLMYSTISADAIRIAQESFIKLYRAGNVKSVDAPVMWDVDFQTAVAQAEIEDREVQGAFHDIKFKVVNGESLVISTTRPEMLPACIAIAAHPDDARFKHLFGKMAVAPLFGFEVPIMPSDHVNPEKGTGIMMICTFGDQDDVAFWKKHKLPLKQIIGRDGRIVEREDVRSAEPTDLSTTTPPLRGTPSPAKGTFQCAGMTIKAARKQIVEGLRESGDLIGEPKIIMHAVKFYEKGSSPIEFVPSRQWFVKILDKKDMLIAAADQIRWTPDHMKSRFKNWTEGLNQDWAISRQRFFGVPFPVWYRLDAAGEQIWDEPILSAKLPCDPAVDVPDGFAAEQRGVPGGFVADMDVMDTWATSALTPAIAMAKITSTNHPVRLRFATARHPSTLEGNLSVPFDARWSGHDIIRTWNFYTILITMLNNDGKLPWRELWINGFVLDPDRKKMSKSKGNVVVPQDLVERFGADAIRLWAASAKWGTDGINDENIMDQKRKLAMKFWNAGKFVLAFVEGSNHPVRLRFATARHPSTLGGNLDAAFLGKLSAVAAEARKAFAANDHTGALIAVEQAFWGFCDNYLEIVKGRAYARDAAACGTLRFAILEFAKMFAPFMPFVTEEVWQAFGGAGSVHSQVYPAFVAEGDTAGYDVLCELVSRVRGEKSKAGKSMKAAITKLVVRDVEFLRACEGDIRNVLCVEGLEFDGEELVGELAWGVD